MDQYLPEIRKDMSFKIEPDWHSWFKIRAAEAGMSMKDIFQEAVEEWALRRFGPTKGRPPNKRR